MYGSRTSLSHLLFYASVVFALPLYGHADRLQISANQTDGSYSIGATGSSTPTLLAGAAVQVNGSWLKSSDYPRHTITKGTSTGELGPAEEWTLTYAGRPDAPDLQIRLRAYLDRPFGDAQVLVQNTTAKPLKVQAIRTIDAGPDSLNLGGSHAE